VREKVEFLPGAGCPGLFTTRLQLEDFAVAPLIAGAVKTIEPLAAKNMRSWSIVMLQSGLCMPTRCDCGRRC